LLLFRLIFCSRRSTDKPAIASGYGRSRDVHRRRHDDREGDPQRFYRAAHLSKISFAGVTDIAATANPHGVGTRHCPALDAARPGSLEPDRPDALVLLYIHRSNAPKCRLFCKHFQARSSENAVLKRAKT
jgi:hypothetical protein